MIELYMFLMYCISVFIFTRGKNSTNFKILLYIKASVFPLSQEKEMEKQKILYQQARLHARGAAEMVLQMISASKGTF